MIKRQSNNDDFSDFLGLYDSHPISRQYDSWASNPELDLRGKWPLCEYIYLLPVDKFGFFILFIYLLFWFDKFDVTHAPENGEE